MSLNLEARMSEPGVLVYDCATGTNIGHLLDAGAPSVLLNLENQTAVRQHYRNCVSAGAQLILTNTFGGNESVLGSKGIDDPTQIYDLNLAGATLAREVAGDSVFVMGDIGPTGKILAEDADVDGTITGDQAKRIFHNQAIPLIRGGTDGIQIETMSSILELVAAIEGAQEAMDALTKSGDLSRRLPIMATMSFDMGRLTDPRTMMGKSPGNFMKATDAYNLLGRGANCGRLEYGLSQSLLIVHLLRIGHPHDHLVMKLNAGAPHDVDGSIIYDATPQDMAKWADMMAKAGVKIVGGCCGTTYKHLEAMAEAVVSYNQAIQTP